MNTKKLTKTLAGVNGLMGMSAWIICAILFFVTGEWLWLDYSVLSLILAFVAAFVGAGFPTFNEVFPKPSRKD